MKAVSTLPEPASPAGRCGAARAAEYPRLAPGIFLNAASYGPLPQSALDALSLYHERRAAAQLGPHDFGDLLPRARAAAASLVGASPEEIALVPNTNVGVNIGASIAHQRARDGDVRHTIVVSEREFPANVYPWLALERYGFRVRFVGTDPLGHPAEQALFDALQGDDVAVFALSAVQFASGWRAPLEKFGELCRDRDILFVVDAIQALGVVPVDVRSAHIDVLASGAQKWLCSPFGTGFAYVRAPLCQAYEPELPGWLSFGASGDFNRLCTYRYDLYPDARRFEVATLAFPDFTAMAVVLELINGIGVANVWEHVQSLVRPLLGWADAHDEVTVTSASAPERRSGIVCLRTRDVQRTFDRLSAEGVTAALREGAIRFSPHFYNTGDELLHVVELLERFA